MCVIPGLMPGNERWQTWWMIKCRVIFKKEKRQLDVLNQAEQRKLSQENAELCNFLREQAAEERHFAAMKAQQQANQQLPMELVGTVMCAVCPVQPRCPPASMWASVPSPSARPAKCHNAASLSSPCHDTLLFSLYLNELLPLPFHHHTPHLCHSNPCFQGLRHLMIFSFYWF